MRNSHQSHRRVSDGFCLLYDSIGIWNYLPSEIICAGLKLKSYNMHKVDRLNSLLQIEKKFNRNLNLKHL